MDAGLERKGLLVNFRLRYEALLRLTVSPRVDDVENFFEVVQVYHGRTSGGGVTILAVELALYLFDSEEIVELLVVFGFQVEELLKLGLRLDLLILF